MRERALPGPDVDKFSYLNQSSYRVLVWRWPDRRVADGGARRPPATGPGRRVGRRMPRSVEG